VLQASNGGEAIQIARSRNPDAILMDIGMPIMDGISAAETLKGDPDTASVPIVMVTAHTLRRERERMVTVSDGCLYKPCAPHEILAELRRCLESGGGTSAV
jgi:CheY-like chemotaxis protein